MKVAITGANGYIGKHVTKKLLDLGHHVVAVGINTDEIDRRADIIVEDILLENPHVFASLGFPDACLHMAWRDGFVHNSDAHMQRLSAHYTFIKNMIDGGLKQISVMGSMHEIGYHVGAIDENTLCNPTNMYGIAKDSLRRSLIVYAETRNVAWQWLRAYYIYGDDTRNHSIFAKILLAAAAGETHFPLNTGRNQYDFISVHELAAQIAACVLHKEVTGIINCCTGKPVSLAEQVERFIAEHNLAIKPVYGVFPDREYDSPQVYGDNTKIAKIMEIV